MDITTPWPDLRLYARDCGEVDPYDPRSADRFRGEEAFAPEVQGWQRWSKPSPEPRLDAGFESVLLAAIAQEAPLLSALSRELAAQIAARFPRAPVLVAVLRAGVPVSGLLSPLLEAHYGESVPIAALSLFYGLGWDEAALRQVVADFPGRPLLFVDGWTSGGGVATQLRASFEGWIARGEEDFTQGRGPLLATLCDPRGKADLSAVRADLFVPCAAFTAPETLGFSRGFAFADGGLFGVYRFPRRYLRPDWVARWRQILDVPAAPLPVAAPRAMGSAPPGFRLDSNEVVRALINRAPREIWLAADEENARQTLSPLLYLAQKRGVPMTFGRRDIEDWGASVVARMS